VQSDRGSDKVEARNSAHSELSPSLADSDKAAPTKEPGTHARIFSLHSQILTTFTRREGQEGFQEARYWQGPAAEEPAFDLRQQRETQGTWHCRRRWRRGSSRRCERQEEDDQTDKDEGSKEPEDGQGVPPHRRGERERRRRRRHGGCRGAQEEKDEKAERECFRFVES
jgi:hypothetical protein